MDFNKKYYHEFASDWQTGWNGHDLDIIASHYRKDILFRSQKAMPLMGTGEIIGLDNLKLYWNEALKRQPNLHFTVINVFEGYRMMDEYFRHRHAMLAPNESQRSQHADQAHHSESWRLFSVK